MGSKRLWARGYECAAVLAINLIFLTGAIWPFGPMTGNEEDYLAQAHKFFRPDRFGPYSSTITDSHAIFLFKAILGPLVAYLGYDGAKTFGRVIVIICYAVALTYLVRTIRVSMLGLIAAYAIFSWAGQATMGGEWIFLGVESKVFAYACVMAAIACFLRDRRPMGRLLLVLAIYFHFLVGGFWTVFLLIAIASVRGIDRDLFCDLGVVSASVVPLAAIVAYEQLAYAGLGPEIDKSVDWVYSIFRNPHHVAPFATPEVYGQFRKGFFLALPLLVLAAGLSLSQKSEKDKLYANLVVVAHVWMILAIGLSYLTRDSGALGKLFMFRPSSLALLLLLFLCAVVSGREAPRYGVSSSVVFLLLLLALGLNGAKWPWPRGLSRDSEARENLALLTFVRDTVADGEIVIVHPKLQRWMKERFVGRPSYVDFKFVPTRPDQIREWYVRLGFRDGLAEGRCDLLREENSFPRVRYMIVPSGSTEIYRECWKDIYSDRLGTLLQVKR